MKVLLFQVDRKFPNLALMKLATWHRKKGDEVLLTPFLRDVPFFAYNKAYASSIFEFSKERRARFREMVPDAITGGDGYRPIWNDLKIIGRGLGSNLREVIKDCDPDTIRPDFSDYPKFTASIGYTQRGCRLDCGFCRMKTREGEARKVVALRDLWRGDPWPKNIVLLDNDFFGQAEWREQLDEARTGDYKICFNQGINIRLVNEEQAIELKKVFYCDDQFKVRRLYTAWDNLGDERVFKAGVATLQKAGIPPNHLMVYMLIGFKKNETEQEIFYRFNEMVALGCRPYPMVFDRSNKRLCHFQTWVIQRFYEHVPWEKYDLNEARRLSRSGNDLFKRFNADLFEENITVSVGNVKIKLSAITARELYDALSIALKEIPKASVDRIESFNADTEVSTEARSVDRIESVNDGIEAEATKPPLKKSFAADAQQQIDKTPITNSQWCDLLNAGTSEGMSVDAVNAFILKTYGCKTRALPSGKYEEAVAALKVTVKI